MGKKKLKIAFISIYSGSVQRGVETYVHELASRLSKDNTVDVFQEGKPILNTKYNIFRVGMNINWEKLDRPSLTRRFFLDYRSRQIALFTIKTLSSIWKNKYHVVIPVNGGWQAFLVRIITLTYGGKVVIPGQSGKGWDDRVNLITMPNIFVAISKDATEWGSKFWPFVKTCYIPNGVDLIKFSPKGKKQKLSLSHPIVLSVGALIPSKRHDLTIKAVSRTNASLLIVGVGQDQEKLQSLGNKLLPGRFLIREYPHVKMPDVYRSVDLLTFSTVPWESFGIVMIEAMAVNLPVVASDDAIRSEIVGNAGMLIDPVNTKAYAEAINVSLKKKWGNLPRQQAEKYSWETVAKDYQKLFNNLIR